MPRKFIPVECRCRRCGTHFVISLGDANAGGGTYCSLQCSRLDTRNRMAQPDNAWCVVCGEGFRIKPSRLAIGKGLCCSLKCKLAWRAAEPLWSRIWRQVEYGGIGCWEWRARRDVDGYGMIFIRRKGTGRGGGSSYRVTREVWRLVHGVYPTMACHHCDNRACVRPSHLYDGTPQSNMDDMYRRGRARPSKRGGARGERHVNAKLTESLVRTIRERYAAGEKQVPLAVEYGVSQAAINALLLRKTWKEVT